MTGTSRSEMEMHKRIWEDSVIVNLCEVDKKDMATVETMNIIKYKPEFNIRVY